HTEQGGILMDGGKQTRPLPLELDAEKIDHVTPRQYVIQPIGDFNAQLSDLIGDQRRGAANDDFGAKFQKSVDIAAGDPAVGDVADQRDRQTLDAPLGLADRKYVEQALRGV